MKKYNKIIAIALLLAIQSCKKEECKTCYTTFYKINICSGYNIPNFVAKEFGIGGVIDSIRSNGVTCNVDTAYNLQQCGFELELLMSMGVKCK